MIGSGCVRPRLWIDSPTQHMSLARSSGHNEAMIPFHSTAALLLLALALPAQAADSYVPWPSKEKLREIQLTAYSCSRENDTADCSRSRSLADALMDHPRLPVVCKDVLWAVIERSTTAASNNYKRRDSIDSVARRLTISCAEPVKKSPTPNKPQGGQNPGGGGNGFGFGSS